MNIATFQQRLFVHLSCFCILLSLIPTSHADVYIYQSQTGKMLYTDHIVQEPGYKLIKKNGQPVRHSAQRGEVFITRFNSRMEQKHSTKTGNNQNRFDHMIQFAARSYAVDPALIKAVIHAESSFNPNAVSRVGAQGLMQLMPATAGMYAVQDPYNPKQNIMAGSKHLKYLLDKYNDKIELALAAYNAGEGRVKKYNGIPPYPETQNYIKKVKRLKQSYRRYISL